MDCGQFNPKNGLEVQTFTQLWHYGAIIEHRGTKTTSVVFVTWVLGTILHASCWSIFCLKFDFVIQDP